MNELISYKYIDNWFINKLTEELDLYLTKDYKILKKDILYSTYIHKNFKKNIHFIRKFGATRGMIRCNNYNIIKEIKIYEKIGYSINNGYTLACYKKDVLNILDKYIESKIIFER
jgi:hypothetical protein